MQMMQRVKENRCSPEELLAIQSWGMWAFPPTDQLAWAQKFVPDYVRDDPSPMHRELSDDLCRLHLTDEYGKKQVGDIKTAYVSGRGFAKSAWASKIDPLYSTVHGLEKYILLTGNATSNAQENLAAIKDQLENNSDLAEEYPWACGPGPIWNVDQIVTRNGVRIHAVGKGKKIRGRGFGAYRPSHIVGDDLQDDIEVLSEDQRNKDHRWLHSVLLPAGDQYTSVVLVGTALHREDEIQKLKKKAGWDVKTFPALINEPERHDLWKQWQLLYTDFELPAKERLANAQLFFELNQQEMQRGAEVLWPARFGLLELQKWRAEKGESAFAREMQGDPQSQDQCEWPDYYFSDSIWFDEWPPLRLRVIALDPSKGKNDTSDYSAYVMLGWGEDGRLYVDADLERRHVTKICEDGLGWFQRFGADSFVVETNQFQELLEVELLRIANERGLLVPIHGYNNLTNKVIRIRRIGPFLHQGRIRFLRRSLGSERLVNQLREFPHCNHDDGPDALEMAIAGLQALIGNLSVESD